MKLLLLFIAFAGFCFGQTGKSYSVLPIIENRVYDLDGGIIVTRTSRVVIPIELPANTVEWYYMFTSHSNENAVEAKQARIDLASQLTRAIDESGFTAGMLSYLFAPSGSSGSNVYLFNNPQDAQNFVNKTDQDLFPIQWNPVYRYSIMSATQGTQKINLADGKRYYIGIQAGDSPVFVKIEVAAVISETAAQNNGWTEENKKLIGDLLTEGFMSEEVKPDQAAELSNCIVESVVKNYPQAVFFSLSEAGINKILEEYASLCYKQIAGVDQTDRSRKATTYGNLGWEYYESGDIDKAIEYSLKALELQPDLAYVKSNMGLFYLIKGDEEKANDFYIDAITTMKNDRISGKDYLKAAIDDIENAVKRYPELKGYKPILGEIKNEYASW